MEVTLTDDQEFFRDTTRRFLESKARSRTSGRSPRTTQGFDRGYWRQGAELGLDLAPRPRGPRRRQHQRAGRRRPHAGGRRVRPPHRARAAAAHQRGRRPRSRGPAATSRRPRCCPRSSPVRSSTAWCVERAAHRRRGRGAVTAPGRWRRVLARRDQAPVEAAAQADLLLVTADDGDGLAQFLIAARHGRRVDHTTREPRPDPSVRQSRARRRTRAAIGGGRRARERRCRCGASAAAGARDPDRRDGRRRADGVRLHARVGIRPLLVRPPARVVPGAQASVRRHEDVARGEPRDGVGRSPERAGRRAECRRDREHGEGVHRRLPAPSSCRTACRCTVASASRTSTTSTCTSAASPLTASPTAPRPTIAQRIVAFEEAAA